MKNILRLLTISLICLPLAIASCKKDDHHHDDDDNPIGSNGGPEITILSPSAGTTIDAGTNVNIKASIKHTAELHEYGFKLKNESTGAIVAEKTIHGHEKEVTLDENWTNNVSGHSDMKLQVEATDHAGNKSSKEISFHCHH